MGGIMKKRTRIILIIVSLLLLPPIIATILLLNTPYRAKYPKYLNKTYCEHNYVEADPNLQYLCGAINKVQGTFFQRVNHMGEIYNFFAIKNVPADQYLGTYHHAVIFSSGYSIGVFRHKDIAPEFLEQHTATSAIFYSQNKIEFVVL